MNFTHYKFRENICHTLPRSTCVPNISVHVSALMLTFDISVTSQDYNMMFKKQVNQTARWVSASAPFTSVAPETLTSPPTPNMADHVTTSRSPDQFPFPSSSSAYNSNLSPEDNPILLRKIHAARAHLDTYDFVERCIKDVLQRKPPTQPSPKNVSSRSFCDRFRKLMSRFDM